MRETIEKFVHQNQKMASKLCGGTADSIVEFREVIVQYLSAATRLTISSLLVANVVSELTRVIEKTVTGSMLKNIVVNNRICSYVC